MKAEVYTWRVSTELKTGLEQEARRRRISLSAALDLAAREWLKTSGVGDDDEQQRRLHQAASKCLGVVAGGDARRSEDARQAVRKRLRRKHER
jgi:hypothetical protein